MKCAVKSQKPWLSLGEEGTRVQLDRVTDGCSEVVGIQLNSLVDIWGAIAAWGLWRAGGRLLSPNHTWLYPNSYFCAYFP